MPSAATWMHLEIVILSEVSQRQIPHIITCMWHLKQWYKWNYLWDRNKLRHRKQTYGYQGESVQFSRSVMSDSLLPHESQHARPPCPSPTPGVHSDSRSLSKWRHSAISSSVVPFSSHLQSFPASGSFSMSQFFASCGESIEVSASASVLPMNIQDWFPLGWTGWISLQSKGLTRVFS